MGLQVSKQDVRSDVTPDTLYIELIITYSKTGKLALSVKYPLSFLDPDFKLVLVKKKFKMGSNFTLDNFDCFLTIYD